MSEIKSTSIEMVGIENLIPNPKNPNSHPPEQIERLAAIIKAQGWRNPIVVSNRSGFVVAGHGRLQAARAIGLKELPVMYQDFKDEATEYAYIVADNAISEWASLDLGKINSEVIEFGPDFEIDMLGLKGFEIEPVDRLSYEENNKEIDTENFGNDLVHSCPKCGFEFND